MHGVPGDGDVWSRIGEGFSKDTTVFLGLVVHGSLDAVILQRKAEELLIKWPVLSGAIVRKVYPQPIKSFRFRSRKHTNC